MIYERGTVRIMFDCFCEKCNIWQCESEIKTDFCCSGLCIFIRRTCWNPSIVSNHDPPIPSMHIKTRAKKDEPTVAHSANISKAAKIIFSFSGSSILPIWTKTSTLRFSYCVHLRIIIICLIKSETPVSS